AAEQRIDPEQVLAAQPLHLVFPGQVESRDDQTLLIKPKRNAIVCDLRACDSAPRDEHRLLSHLFVVARKAEHHRQHFEQAVHKPGECGMGNRRRRDGGTEGRRDRETEKYLNAGSLCLSFPLSLFLSFSLSLIPLTSSSIAVWRRGAF